MKKYFRLAAAAVVLSIVLTGCGNDGSSSETTTSETITQTGEYEDLTDKLNELSNEIIDLAAKAEPLHEQGKLDSDKYAAIQQLSTTLEDIGTEGNSENTLKYNELKKRVDELTYDVNAAENPQELDEDTALTSLMECIEEAEPVLTSANEQGKLLCCAPGTPLFKRFKAVYDEQDGPVHLSSTYVNAENVVLTVEQDSFLY